MEEKDLNRDEIIIVDDDQDTANQGKEIVISDSTDEEPIFFIEKTDEDNKKPVSKKRYALIGAAAATLIIIAAGAVAYYIRHNTIGLPISTTPEENIEKLKAEQKDEKAEVIMTTDAAAGVEFNMYEIKGLEANIEFKEPSLNDESVYLYSNSADITTEDTYLGTLVAEGKEMKSSGATRLGYFASANGNEVIGISRSDEVKDYVMERGGSFFRQFILVSGGETPKKFYLHGKVERRALARMTEDLTGEDGTPLYDKNGKPISTEKIYYIESKNKEKLEDFANALKAYGFTDAIYMTGSDAMNYYRDAEGQRHDFGKTENAKPEEQRNKTVKTPYLVWRKK